MTDQTFRMLAAFLAAICATLLIVAVSVDAAVSSPQAQCAVELGAGDH